MANALRGLGIGKGDVVGIYMGMVPELPVAMLACARIGAPHVVVFGGFSAESLGERLESTGAKGAHHPGRGVAEGGRRRAQDDRRRGGQAGADDRAAWWCSGARAPTCRCRPAAIIWWHELVAGQADTCEPELVDAEHMLYVLHTSGTTAKPKARRAHDRRVPHLRRRDPQVDLRHPRRRRLVVRRRHRLGDRPQLHRLRAARERRDGRALRGRPDVPRPGPTLGDHRAAPRDAVLHGADPDPRVHQVRARRSRRGTT